MSDDKMQIPQQLGFSDSELKVLNLLLRGIPNKQIAIELDICEKTVEKHLTNIYNKIGVTSRAEAILWVVRQGRDFPT